ncbi:hypothetical protein SLI_3836 [Streptomyces lividans 1326]|uniref:Uncharacterized protein n=1 Tax=Streptomyces lividans 1326 TaxID=1200984 RepID=A0A7U9HBX4_STRLI|nr:hypothetical protein SLI_3836 [Streptomyces lividans 1326]
MVNADALVSGRHLGVLFGYGGLRERRLDAETGCRPAEQGGLVPPAAVNRDSRCREER